MERHRIPQNIMDVDFKLFGSLTVKQFGSLAFSFFVAFCIYIFKLPAIIGWPLIIFFVLLGLALAFVQVNGLPFARWLANFILALLTPQSKVWRKSPKVPKTFTQTFKVPKHTETTDFHKQVGEELVQNLNDTNYTDTNDDRVETDILNNIDQMLGETQFVENNQTNNQTQNLTEAKQYDGLYGKVLTTKGNPVNQINILLLDKQFKVLEETETDSKGVFQFKNTKQFDSGIIEIRWIDKNRKIHHIRKPIDLKTNPNILPIIITIG